MRKLQVRVTSAQHRGKARHFHLAAPPFARFLVMTMAAHFFQSALAVDPFFQTAQRFFHRLTFLKTNLGQSCSLPSQLGGGGGRCRSTLLLSKIRTHILNPALAPVKRLYLFVSAWPPANTMVDDFWWHRCRGRSQDRSHLRRHLELLLDDLKDAVKGARFGLLRQSEFQAQAVDEVGLETGPFPQVGGRLQHTAHGMR